MKYVVAVSGGVDSVVLLDMLAKSGNHELVVAHFDHGIRKESADDAKFVGLLTQMYNLPFETQRAELGPKASEEQARDARYAFLRRIAKKHGAQIVTAHHQNDVIETIAINIVRGTGWRGLAVLNDKAIHRPLLDRSKHELYEYALQNSLEWVEDATNTSDAYLRNRLRKRLGGLEHTQMMKIIELWHEQCRLSHKIDIEAAKHVTASRYMLTVIDEPTALELLRAILSNNSLSLDRPQRTRLLHAIKTARPGSSLEPGGHMRVQFTQREFIVKYPL
jgi:tRNA(Ile)-lysidine synthase